MCVRGNFLPRHASWLTDLLSRFSLLLNPCAAVLYGFAPKPVRMVRPARIDRLTCRMCNVQLPYSVRKSRLLKVPPAHHSHPLPRLIVPIRHQRVGTGVNTPTKLLTEKWLKK
jgi:hypothetical protein